jgi:hypothetical protein
MKELNEYRTKLMGRLVSAAREFREVCLAVPNAFAPLDESGWNAHQVAAHTRDVNRLVYGARARQTAEEENPEFPNFDGDAYMTENYNSQEPLSEILDGLIGEVEVLTGMLGELPAEAWSRQSRHATLGGGFTLQTWVERDLAHIEEHLETMRKVI